MESFTSYECSSCGAPLMQGPSNQYSHCSEVACASSSKLIDLKLPAKAQKRNYAIISCQAVDATFDPYNQSWRLIGLEGKWELVESINKKLLSWPKDVPQNDSNRIGLKDGSIPCWFRRKAR